MNRFNQYKYQFLGDSFLSYKKIDKDSLRLKSKYFVSTLILMLLMSFCNLLQAATNTGLVNDDQVTGPFPIGFEFKYYGKSVTKFYVTSNGLLQFANPITAYNNTCLPASNDTLYVFWDDLITAGNPKGTVQYELRGEAPNRQLIVQWNNQYFYGTRLPMGTFQAILYESSNNIKYQYRFLVDNRSRGNSATIGIQGPNRQIQQIGCNQANSIAPEQAILFTPNSDMTDYSVDKKALYDFIDISGLTPNAPVPASNYSNKALTWTWNKLTILNAYQISIQDQDGNTIFNGPLSDSAVQATSFTYTEDLVHGKSYRARIRGSVNKGGTWEAWSSLSPSITIDTVKPSATIDSFSRIEADQVKIAYNVSDDLSGVAAINVQIATDADFKNIIKQTTASTQTNYTQIAELPTTDILYARINALDKAGNQSAFTEPKQLAITTPVIITPITQAVIKQAKVDILGTAEIASKVQLYLNDIAFGSPITVDNNGQFTTQITLPTEGDYKLTANANNNIATSELSQEVNFTFQLPLPKAIFVTPADNLTLSAPTTIEISALDDLGIAKVDIFIDDKAQASLTQAPYQTDWDVTALTNGNHTIKAIITNTSGKTTTISRPVTVKVLAPKPPPTSYTGEILTVTPTISYGPQPITIKGRAIYRTDTSNAANIPLQLVLTVDGFVRKINLVTDNTGLFSYNFVPQATDTGTYSVTAIHPKETKVTPQSNFTIDRIKFNYSGYSLKAARNITSQITVNAAASANTTALHWVVRAADQPSGKLPTGIKIDNQTIDIMARRTANTLINFTADDTAAETGTIVLVALANNSADLIRGKLTINYQLYQATASLYATPTYIETGVQQNKVISERFNLGNRGLVTAKNIKLQLLDEKGNKPASWIFLSSANTLDKIEIDETTPLQLTAQPDNNVADGIYRFNIHVTADNAAAGTIPVSVAVTQTGQGAVRFDVADIYTATLNDQGQPILGVNKATIKLQNEAVLTKEYSLTTDNQGIALLDKLPPGVYRYRASAAEHQDASGRVVIRPNVTVDQHIFLEYQTINIEFSVTETTIQDIYDITLNATFNTKVPAPVVLLQPLSINLAGMQIGEQKTGQLTLTNYGLVQADNVQFTVPKSDSHFKYEFFGEIPTVLAPKSSITIPYRVTALAPSPAKANQVTTNTPLARMLTVASAKEDCSSYTANYSVAYQSDCANGDISYGSNSGNFYQIKGGNCTTTGLGNWGSIGGGNGLNTNWGGGSGTQTPTPIPMTQGCTPDSGCKGQCCGDGAGAGDK